MTKAFIVNYDGALSIVRATSFKSLKNGIINNWRENTKYSPKPIPKGLFKISTFKMSKGRW